MKGKSKRSSFLGFTLVELVIVIAVIAILAAVLIPTFVGVIDSANNSADIQLAANMNTVAATMNDADKSMAENIRKAMLENGLYDLSTKKTDNIIVYNTGAQKFEVKNIAAKGNTFITSVSAEEIAMEATPYSLEEIFAGEIIVSTGGNPLSTLLYRLHNLTGEEDEAKEIGSLLSKISSKEVQTKVAAMISTTAFVINDSTSGQKVLSMRVTGTNVTQSEGVTDSLLRVAFNDDVESFDIGLIKGAYRTCVLTIPQSVTSVSLEEDDLTAIPQSLVITGNTNALSELFEVDEDGEPTEVAKKLEGMISDLDTAKKTNKDPKTWESFANKQYYVVNEVPETKNPEIYYTDIERALSDASASAALWSNGVKDVTIADNITVSKDITIPGNVTLQIPYGVVKSESGDDTYLYGYNKDYSTMRSAALVGVTDDSHKKYELVIEGATLNIQGEVKVGAVMSHTGQYYQGHTSGDYGQITNNGNIIVNEGGTLDICGYVKGNGTVEAKYGGNVYEPFIVTDFSGGNNSLQLYTRDQSPFMRYTMLNIQNSLIINYGARLWAHCNLYAMSVYNTTDEIVIGYVSDDKSSKGLISLKPNARAICNYDTTPLITAESVKSSSDPFDTAVGNNLTAGDIGRTKVNIVGNAQTDSLSLLSYVTTSKVLFPIPYNFEFILTDGTFDVYNNYVLLPGSKLTVAEGATLNITEGATFYAMDYLVQGATMDGKAYPSKNLLEKSSGLTSYAQLVVNGVMNVSSGTASEPTKVGGIINSNGEKAQIKIGDANIDLGGKFDIGGRGCYSANTSSYERPLRLMDADAGESGDIFRAGLGCTYNISDKDGKCTVSDTAASSIIVSTDESGSEFSMLKSDNTTIGYYKHEEKSVTLDIAVTGKWQQPPEEVQKQVSEYVLPSEPKLDDYTALLDKYNVASAAVQKRVGNNLDAWATSAAEKFRTDYQEVFSAEASSGGKLDIELAKKAIAAERKYNSLSDFVRGKIDNDNAISEKIAAVRTDERLEYCITHNGEEQYGDKLVDYWKDNIAKEGASGKFEVVVFSDINVTEKLTVPEGVEVELDLNGSTLSGNIATMIENKGSLHLYSSTEEMGVMTNNSLVATNSTVKSVGKLAVDNIKIESKAAIGIKIDGTSSDNAYAGITVENFNFVIKGGNDTVGAGIDLNNCKVDYLRNIKISSEESHVNDTIGINIATEVREENIISINSISGIEISNIKTGICIPQLTNGNEEITSAKLDINITEIDDYSYSYSALGTAISIALKLFKCQLADGSKISIGNISDVSCAGVINITGNTETNMPIEIDRMEQVDVSAQGAFCLKLTGNVTIKSFSSGTLSILGSSDVVDPHVLSVGNKSSIHIVSGYFKAIIGENAIERDKLFDTGSGRRAGTITYPEGCELSTVTGTNDGGEDGYYYITKNKK